MFEGMIIFTPSPCKLSDSFSIAGRAGFRILSISFGRLYKASFILAALNPILGILS